MKLSGSTFGSRRGSSLLANYTGNGECLTDLGRPGRRPGFGGWPVALQFRGVSAFIAGHVRTNVTELELDYKGGRWTKDWCGGVRRGGRMRLSGRMWTERRRSGRLCPPPHRVRKQVRD